MGAPSKRARKIRAASEFDISRLQAALDTPKSARSVYSWALSDILAARDAQLRGSFNLPARLAESMRTDDALAVAYENRLAPQRCIKVSLVAAKGARGASIAKEAEALFGQAGVGIHPDTLADVHGCLVNHGVAFGYNVAVPREDGSRIDIEMRYWPIEYVRWDPVSRMFMTRVDPETVQPGDAGEQGSAFEIPIVHGDGRWVIFKKHEIDPFRQEAALLPGALVWARHAFAIRDWAKGSVSHGNAKVVGEMPVGMATHKADGSLEPEAAAFLELLKALANADSPAGIRPAGSKTELLTNNSTAWQVWNELTRNAEKAAARIYLGTDGTLGSQGGAPGVDIDSLFGVAKTRVEGDLKCIERGLLTGVIEPWCALNFGDSSLAPQRVYQIPDGDEEAQEESLIKRKRAFFDDVKATRDNGFSITQEYVDALAEEHGIPAPMLPEETAKAPSIALAPTDIARVVSVNEARASAGLGPLLAIDGSLDPDGRLTVEEYSAKKKNEQTAPTAPAPAPVPLRSVS